MKVEDSSQRYGLTSRLLHWGMVLLFVWQFITTGVRILAKDSTLDQFFWATHKPLGVLLMALIVIRLLWAIFNAGSRPELLNLGAKIGHLSLYALMFIIPSMALLRQYGSDRAFAPFGVPLMSGSGEDKIEWMVAPANLLHGWLGWLLLAMIAGHAFMAIAHKSSPGKESVLRRML